MRHLGGLLHQEMAEMPVKEHVHMLGAQFLASALRPDHPSHHLASADPGPRQMKYTLRSKYISSVEPLLVNGVMAAADYKEALKTIHTSAVSNCIDSLGSNPILNAIPPKVDSAHTLIYTRVVP